MRWSPRSPSSRSSNAQIWRKRRRNIARACQWRDSKSRMTQPQLALDFLVVERQHGVDQPLGAARRGRRALPCEVERAQHDSRGIRLQAKGVKLGQDHSAQALVDGDARLCGALMLLSSAYCAKNVGHGHRRKLQGEDRFGALVAIDPGRHQPVEAAAGGDVGERDAAVIVAEEPAEGVARDAFPALVAGDGEGGRGGIDRRRRLERLLVEGERQRIGPAEAVRPDRAERAARPGLDRRPASRAWPGRPRSSRGRRAPAPALSRPSHSRALS